VEIVARVEAVEVDNGQQELQGPMAQADLVGSAQAGVGHQDHDIGVESEG
jgi:hypothetical protein